MSALMSMRTRKTERKRGKAKNRKTERGGTYPDREYRQALPSYRKCVIIFHSRK